MNGNEVYCFWTIKQFLTRNRAPESAFKVSPQNRTDIENLRLLHENTGVIAD